MSISIQTTGHGNISRAAERAILRIKIKDDGTDAATVSKNVFVCTTRVQEVLEPVSETLPSGDPSPNAAVTHWSMGALDTYSYPIYNREGNINGRTHHASTSFEVKFRDFGVLASVASDLSAMEFVNLDGIEWRLTDVTKAALASEARALAARDALARAEDYAKALGGDKVTVVELVEERGVDEGSYGGQVRRLRMTAADRSDGDDEDPGLSFQPEEVELGAMVTVKSVSG